MKYFKIKKINKVCLLTISNGPFNTLSSNLLKELDKFFDDTITDNSIRSIVITGDGDKAFIAGADIKEMQSMSKKEALNHSKLGQNLFSKIEDYNKPIIAAINGYALGGGCELALSCHMRYASESALISQPEVKLGLIAGFGGTQRLGKVVSKGKAMEILLTGKMYSAFDCFEIGLVDQVFENNNLIDEVCKIAEMISINGFNAVSKSIDLVNKSYDLKLKEGLLIESIEFGKLFQEKDSIEGISAFLEDREPKF